MQQMIIPSLLFRFLYLAPQDLSWASSEASIPLISAIFAEEAKVM
jgi:hypothetical protein